MAEKLGFFLSGEKPVDSVIESIMRLPEEDRESAVSSMFQDSGGLADEFQEVRTSRSMAVSKLSRKPEIVLALR